MSADRVLVVLLFVLVPCLVLNWGGVGEPAFEEILARLRHECDPENPEADYYWSQRSMPTERKRQAIIDDCRKIGSALLTHIHRQIEHEADEEVRGMLIVIAASLGHTPSLEQAGREMTMSDFPAVRISAARTLRQLHDPASIDWLLLALNDGHFVINGGCGTLREKFYPVRGIARLALLETAAKHPENRALQHWKSLLEGMSPEDSYDDLWRRWREAKMRELEEMARAEYFLRKNNKGR